MEEPNDQVGVTPVERTETPLLTLFFVEFGADPFFYPLKTTLGFHIIGFLLNALLYLSLRVFSGFHVHMRILCRNACFCFMMSSLYGLYRCYSLATDWTSSRGNFDESPSSTATCLFTWSIQPYLCVLLCVFAVSMVVERNIATNRFLSYEYTDYHLFCSVPCYISRIPVVIYAIYLLWVLSEKRNQVECELIEQNKPVLFRTGGQAAVAMVSAICSVYFKKLTEQNVVTKKEYIEYNYSSLSHRYQMHENATTCSLMYKLLSVMAVFNLLPIFFGFVIFDVHQSFPNRLIQSEMWYLLQTAINIFFPCFFMYSDAKLYRRIWSTFSACKTAASMTKVPAGFLPTTA